MESPELNLGATYQLNRTFYVGGLFRASLVDKMFIPSLTASVNGRLMRNVSASVSYSITRGSYVNLGAGLTAKLGPFQLYLETDNLLACNYTNTQSANARFGINLLFGHKDHKKKKKAEGYSVERRGDRRAAESQCYRHITNKREIHIFTKSSQTLGKRE